MPPHANRTPYPNSICGTLLLILVPVVFFQLCFGLTGRWFLRSTSAGQDAACPAVACQVPPPLSLDEIMKPHSLKKLSGSGLVGVAKGGIRTRVAMPEGQGPGVRVWRDGDGGVEFWFGFGRGEDENSGAEEVMMEAVVDFCSASACEVEWVGMSEPSGAVIGKAKARSQERQGKVSTLAWRDEDFEMQFRKGTLERVNVRLKPPDG